MRTKNHKATQGQPSGSSGKPDRLEPALIQLVRLLARQAAREWLESQAAGVDTMQHPTPADTDDA